LRYRYVIAALLVSGTLLLGGCGNELPAQTTIAVESVDPSVQKPSISSSDSAAEDVTSTDESETATRAPQTESEPETATEAPAPETEKPEPGSDFETESSEVMTEGETEPTTTAEPRVETIYVKPVIMDSYYYPVDYSMEDTYVMLAYTVYHGTGMRYGTDDYMCLIQMAEEENPILVISELLDKANEVYFHHLYVYKDNRIYLLNEYVGQLWVNMDNTRLRCVVSGGTNKTYRCVDENLVEADAGGLGYILPKQQSIFVYPLSVENLDGLNGMDIPLKLGGAYAEE